MLNKLSAIAASVATPALLFLGAGTAQADISASARSAPGGLDVFVNSFGNPAPGGWCTFTSRVQGNPWGKPLPATDVPFYLETGGQARLWFPSYPTGSTWDIIVKCPGTGPQVTALVW